MALGSALCYSTVEEPFVHSPPATYYLTSSQDENTALHFSVTYHSFVTMAVRNNNILSSVRRMALLVGAVVALIGGASAFVAPQPRQQMQFSKNNNLPSANNYLNNLQQQQQQHEWQRSMSSDNSNDEAAVKKSDLPFLLDPGTKGGALFLSLVAFVVPILFYEFVTSVFGVDGLEAGKWIGGGFTVIATLAWVGTYIFRVATKDMTYVRRQ